MPTDKDIKKAFKEECAQHFEKYYAVRVLREEGFSRKHCSCGTWFWTVNQAQEHCGDPACSGGFRFFEGTPAKKKMDYIQLWNEFSRLFTEWGYTPITRYPVVARWRADTDFVQASIYDFQPYVVSGEVKPPANPLVVPQFCVRFNDIDNVGITGAHYTGFVMIGQHAFDTVEHWNQEKYFRDIHRWLTEGLGLPKEEITYHEDAWAGGGNYGPCMEFFSRGLELGNQVYMMFERTEEGRKELTLKVLDMGMGHERNAWFTQGTATSYETTFPTVCKNLFERTGIEVDKALMQKFLPYSSYLNIDEVEDIDAVWEDIATKLQLDAVSLKNHIMPLAALFSVGEHARSLLFTLSDGALPSNVGGGYNLRVILRRALGFIDSYGWKLSLGEICEWHAEYLQPLFPELLKNLENVKKIIAVEEKKYEATKEKTQHIVSKLLDKEITEEKLIELYDSNGILPELIKEEARKAGKSIVIPDDFYARVAERHEQREQITQTRKEEKLNLTGIPDTNALYFDDYLKLQNKGSVLKILGNDVILDKTVAYPTSGGQLHDLAFLNGQETEMVFKQGAIIIHRLKEAPAFKEGDLINVTVDEEHRRQLAQHHTSTHLVGAAARQLLGSHVNQAGAKKAREKAHLDITHYESLTDEELKHIEARANELVQEDALIEKTFLPRDEAEKKYGMRLYQGGAVPGNRIRVVNIRGIDVQACGGTHLNHTGEVGVIRILKSTKIQDGVVRITFTAGKASEERKAGVEEIIDETARLLGVNASQVPSRAQEVFELWKKARKASKKGTPLDKEAYTLSSTAEESTDILDKTASALQTQKEHILKTLKRFLQEIEQSKSGK